MSCTSIHMTAVLREATPTSDGWRRVEAERASFSCSCGATFTGRSTDEVHKVAAPHLVRIGEVLGA